MQIENLSAFRLLVFKDENFTKNKVEHDNDNIRDDFHEQAMPMKLLDCDPHKNWFNYERNDARGNESAELFGNLGLFMPLWIENAVAISHVGKNDGRNPGNRVAD